MKSMSHSKLSPMYRTRAVIAVWLAASLVAASTLLPPAARAGNIECWTDNHGVRECGDSVPPEYSQKKIEVLNSQGAVIKVRPAAKTKAQLAAEARRAKEEAKRKAQAAKQAKQDNILLDTFGSVSEIKYARDEKLKAFTGMITVAQSAVDVLNAKLSRLQGRAADIERAGHKPPKTLLAGISDTQQKIRAKQSFIKAKRKRQDAIRRHYAAEIKRYRELTSGDGASVNSSGSSTDAGSATADPTH